MSLIFRVTPLVNYDGTIVLKIKVTKPQKDQYVVDCKEYDCIVSLTHVREVKLIFTIVEPF